ncbi:MAG: 50S ribosomal protein L13 [Bacteroidales bacterium]|nr:50S ribosomal protein L13 [Bacteroidales bacterium]HPB02817.1 50S ribosomal protein L13 [Bacteroidales bacterium]HPF01510.1 50S ribosomal protein L13 [Bacteroidales bacterium]
MDTLSYKTKSINKANANKEWVIVDATDQSLGRFAAMVAFMLRGKHKPSFTPNSDCGDNVIVINAEKVKLTGNKLTDKEYVRHTGYPGGQRFTNPADLLKRKPEAVVEMAVKGMLPKTKLGAELFRNLYVYAGTEHKHEGQQPKSVNINEIK